MVSLWGQQKELEKLVATGIHLAQFCLTVRISEFWAVKPQPSNSVLAARRVQCVGIHPAAW